MYELGSFQHKGCLVCFRIELHYNRALTFMCLDGYFFYYVNGRGSRVFHWFVKYIQMKKKQNK